MLNQLYNYILKALKRADHRYPMRGIALRKAQRGKKVNPKTKRENICYECAMCKQLFLGTEVQVDHIEPVIPLDGHKSWDETIPRLFCPPEGRQVLCKTCHSIKSKDENRQRREYKRERDRKTSLADTRRRRKSSATKRKSSRSNNRDAIK